MFERENLQRIKKNLHLSSKVSTILLHCKDPTINSNRIQLIVFNYLERAEPNKLI